MNKIIFYAGIAVLIFAVKTGFPQPAMPLPFIGTWKMEQGEVFEHWDVLSAESMKGISYRLEGDRMIITEYLDITRQGDDVIYSAVVIGQNDGKGVDFRMSRVDNTFIFANPDHDFPKKIEYSLINESELFVKVSGNGREFSYNMKRMPATVAQLEQSPRHHEWVVIHSGDRAIHSFVAFPESGTNTLAAIVIHENAGLTEWVRSFADQLAQKGFLVIAPDLLSGFDESHTKTSDFATSDAARNAIYALNKDQITRDLEAVLSYAKGIQSSNGRAVIMGFCWGGAETFRFVTNNTGVEAGLVFYGGAPDTAEEIARISVPVFGFYGGNDQRINAGIPETEARMKQAGKTYDYVIYPGAGHGYMRQGDSPDASAENRNARNASWERIIEILSQFD